MTSPLDGYEWVDLSHTLEEDIPAYPTHARFGKAEVYVVENLKNLDRLPPFCIFLAFPLKIKGGSGSPIRAVALVEP